MKHVEPAGSTPLLEINDLTVSFASRAGTATVVQGISLAVERNQTVGIVGESGSGKSMTSLAIMGLLPAKATTTGSIKLQGQEILGSPERHLRKLRGERMAMVFQDPLSSLNPYYTVGQADRGGLPGPPRRIAARPRPRPSTPWAGSASPSPSAGSDNYPHQFSGGMRQRIMIAMAIAANPTC